MSLFHDPRSSRRKEAHSFPTESQSLVTSAATDERGFTAASHISANVAPLMNQPSERTMARLRIHDYFSPQIQGGPRINWDPASFSVVRPESVGRASALVPMRISEIVEASDEPNDRKKRKRELKSVFSSLFVFFGKTRGSRLPRAVCEPWTANGRIAPHEPAATFSGFPPLTPALSPLRGEGDAGVARRACGSAAPRIQTSSRPRQSANFSRLIKSARTDLSAVSAQAGIRGYGSLSKCAP
jgi:hypothetical protein